MIRYAGENGFETVRKHDRHISEKELKNAIQAKRVLVMYRNDCFAGWLRFFVAAGGAAGDYSAKGSGKRYWKSSKSTGRERSFGMICLRSWHITNSRND